MKKAIRIRPPRIIRVPTLQRRRLTNANQSTALEPYKATIATFNPQYVQELAKLRNDFDNLETFDEYKWQTFWIKVFTTLKEALVDGSYPYEAVNHCEVVLKGLTHDRVIPSDPKGRRLYSEELTLTVKEILAPLDKKNPNGSRPSLAKLKKRVLNVMNGTVPTDPNKTDKLNRMKKRVSELLGAPLVFNAVIATKHVPPNQRRLLTDRIWKLHLQLLRVNSLPPIGSSFIIRFKEVLQRGQNLMSDINRLKPKK